jgi:protein-disulfide isomerase
MRGARWILAAAAVAALGSAGPAASQAKKAPAAAQRDWSRAVAATPEGGYRVGNPNAATKVIEYGSLTCGHCAHFAAEGFPTLLQNHVKTGRVSFEFRNYVRDPLDAVGALLSRCAGAKDYFAVTDAMFEGQGSWVGKMRALPAAERNRLLELPPAEGFPQLAAATGLLDYAAKGGVSGAEAKTCLTSKAGLDQLLALRKGALDQYQLEYTPTFIVNGKKVAASDWAALEPLLGKPGG